MSAHSRIVFFVVGAILGWKFISSWGEILATLIVVILFELIESLIKYKFAKRD